MATTPRARRILALVRPYLSPLLWASLIAVLSAAVGLVAPRVAGIVVDTVIDTTQKQASTERLDLVVLLLVALFAVRGVLTYIETYLIRATGARMLRDLRDRVYSHLVDLAPDFFEKRRLGELLSRIGSDLARVQATITNRVPNGIRAALTFVGTLIMLLLLHVQLTLLALVIIPPIAAIAVMYGRALQKLARQTQDALADTSGMAEEALAGIRTVQAYNGEEVERLRYRSGLGDLLGFQLKNAQLVGRFSGLLSFIGFSAFALVLWYGGRLILDDELSVGELTAFLLYVFSIAGSVGSLGSLYAALRELRGASARTFEILDTRSSIVDVPDARTLPDPRGHVAVRDLSFRYPTADDDAWALRGIDLDIEPGQTVALVGPSGSGKSTLFSLLLRFRDATEGAIEIDGHDVRSLSFASLRASTAIVPQEIFLFSGSIADNIRYGSPDASRSDVESAANAAGAHEFIAELSKGYDEVVGERGVKLSAGQRQRIAIARAFLRRPKLLLLDEATSALDAESEHVVQQALDRLMADRTTLVIAHRLATARRADRIVVLDGGHVVDAGTHTELMDSSDLYQRYWELQALRGVETRA